MDDEYIKKGTADILYAHRCEQLGEYQKAFDLYLSGVEILLHGAQGDSNTARQEHVRKKVLDYMQAAERLKVKILPPTSPSASRRTVAGQGEAHGASGGSSASPSPSASPSALRKQGNVPATLQPPPETASPPRSPPPPSALPHHHSAMHTAHGSPQSEARHVHFDPLLPPDTLHSQLHPHQAAGHTLSREIPRPHSPPLPPHSLAPLPSLPLPPQHLQQHQPHVPLPPSLLLEFDPLAPAAPRMPTSTCSAHPQASARSVPTAASQPHPVHPKSHEDGTPMGSVSLSEESVKRMVDLAQHIMRTSAHSHDSEDEARLAREAEEARRRLPQAERMNEEIGRALGRSARMSPEEERALEDEFEQMVRGQAPKGSKPP